MNERYQRVTKFVTQHPWAIIPDRLDALLEVLALRAEGRVLTDQEIQARLSAAPAPPGRRTVQAVAVVPVFGILAHRMNLMTQMSGGTSTEELAGAVEGLVADPDIQAILLDVDSPGGSVFGVQELADRIYKARGTKPIVAIANATAASAAYWVASQADQVLVTPSGQIGSIGVVAVHQDRSKQAELLGVRHTFVTAGKFKAAGNDMEPLDEATRADMQRRVDQYYGAFVQAVARGRGVPVAEVRDGFGEGRVVSAGDAVRLGMADGVGSLDHVLGRLVAGKPALGPRAAADGQTTDMMPPDEDGECPEGYELGDDGMCHMMPAEGSPAGVAARREADALRRRLAAYEP
jgi:signal peptide peptidase SppA